MPASVYCVADVLAHHGAPREVLQGIGHGAVIWRGSGYFVEVEANAHEILSPYSVQIGVPHDGIEEVMAHCALAADFGALYSEFQGNLPTSEEEFARYLASALDTIGEGPQFLTEEVEDDDWFDGEHDE